jgi:hypothetical protein
MRMVWAVAAAALVAGCGWGGGGCGDRCGPGACREGVCQPFTIAKSQKGPQAVLTDADHVYWTSLTGAIYRCPLDGCLNGPAADFVTGQSTPLGLARDETSLYWQTSPSDLTARDGTVRSCPLAGCTGSPMTVASGLPRGMCLTLADGLLHWSVGNDSGDSSASIVTCAAKGCLNGPTLLATGKEPLGIAVHAGTVYWADRSGRSILACNASGCGETPMVLATGQASPVRVAADDTKVYWTNQENGSVMACLLPNCAGGPFTFATAQKLPTGIAVDTSGVYWTNFGDSDTGGTIMTCPLTGCGAAPRQLAGGQRHPIALALTASRVYWVNVGTVPDFEEGSVMAVAKAAK